MRWQECVTSGSGNLRWEHLETNSIGSWLTADQLTASISSSETHHLMCNCITLKHLFVSSIHTSILLMSPKWEGKRCKWGKCDWNLKSSSNRWLHLISESLKNSQHGLKMASPLQVSRIGTQVNWCHIAWLFVITFKYCRKKLTIVNACIDMTWAQMTSLASPLPDSELPYVSIRAASLIMWQSLCYCLLVSKGMEWLSKAWLEESCCWSASPPAGGGLALHRGGAGVRVEETDGERGAERGRIELERMKHQLISIFTISLWICKPDRSSRHQWLASPLNSREEEEKWESSTSLWCFHPIYGGSLHDML